MPLGDEFQGLPMANLIGAPLTAACNANLTLAEATSSFIKRVGFDENQHARTADFKYDVPDKDGKKTTYEIKTPLLTVVPIPSLHVKTVDITFDMEVKSSSSESEKTDKKGELTGKGKLNLGLFSLSATVHGNISAHRESTRKTDKSAKYHVQVLAEDSGPSEGLSRILDIMHKSIVPVEAKSTPHTPTTEG